METKHYFYKSIVYTVYLEELRHITTHGPLSPSERNDILYSLESSLSSKNRTCIRLYNWIIYFCPFMAHRYGCRFMNNVKRAYMTQKNNHTLEEYITAALDMTICSKRERSMREQTTRDSNHNDQIIDSINELKSLICTQSEQRVDYSRFNNNELRDIINDSFRKLSDLCTNVTELDRDRLIILLQYVTLMNGLLCVWCVFVRYIGCVFQILRESIAHAIMSCLEMESISGTLITQ